MKREFIQVGVISKAHGIKGEVVIRFPEGAVAVMSAESLFLPSGPSAGGEVGLREVKVEKRRLKDKASALVKLAGVDDRNRAEALAGTKVYQDPLRLPEPDQDEFYLHELEGLKVVAAGTGQDEDEGAVLGRVSGVLSTGGHDSLVVQDHRGEFMIPFVDEMVVNIDLSRQVIEVDLPEGLIDATRVESSSSKRQKRVRKRSPGP